jgi:hypothetical protein
VEEHLDELGWPAPLPGLTRACTAAAPVVPRTNGEAVGAVPLARSLELWPRPDRRVVVPIRGKRAGMGAGRDPAAPNPDGGVKHHGRSGARHLLGDPTVTLPEAEVPVRQRLR